MTVTISKKEARDAGYKRYYTGKACLRGHFAERLVSTGTCVACGHDAATAYRKEHPEKHLQALKKQREKNKQERAAYLRKWKQENADRHCHHAQVRRTKKLQACPAWADLEQIQSFYTEAARLTEVSGVKHHVDHIVPLQNKSVCGLHVPANLRVVPYYENLQKHNKLDESLITPLSTAAMRRQKD